MNVMLKSSVRFLDVSDLVSLCCAFRFCDMHDKGYKPSIPSSGGGWIKQMTGAGTKTIVTTTPSIGQEKRHTDKSAG